MTQGLKNLQESAAYKRTTENIQFAKEIAKEKTSGMVANITASGYFQVASNEMSNYLPFCDCRLKDAYGDNTFSLLY